jgi:hypothetical protein
VRVNDGEIRAAFRAMNVPAKQWNAARMEPGGSEEKKLAYLVMKYLREHAPSDARWAKHGRAHGCRFYD